MKLFGDVTEHEKSTAEGLSRMEKVLIRNKKISKINQAKGYVYIAYHWFSLGMEEEGCRLIQKMYEICPDYLDKSLRKHMKDDEKYAELIINLFTQFAFFMANKPENFLPVNITFVTKKG